MRAGFANERCITSASVMKGNESTEESKKATTNRPPPPITATRFCSQPGSGLCFMREKLSRESSRLHQSCPACPIHTQTFPAALADPPLPLSQIRQGAGIVMRSDVGKRPARRVLLSSDGIATSRIDLAARSRVGHFFRTDNFIEFLL